MKNGWCYVDGLTHCVNGACHNEKAPAIISDKGSKFWIQNNKDHRIDGPAAEWDDGSKCWYYDDKYVECKSQQEFDRYLKLKYLW